MVDFEWDPGKATRNLGKHKVSFRPMKKKFQDAADDDLRPEYDLGKMLRDAEQGRYAERFRKGTNLVLLEPDVAAAFPDEQSVNDALKLVIELTRIPNPRKRVAKS